mgnify:FL=1|jgi:hypothetical protein
MIFNKHRESILLNYDIDFKKILDIKYNANSLQELYDEYRNLLGEDHDGVKELKRMLGQLRDIKNKPMRAKGGD